MNSAKTGGIAATIASDAFIYRYCPHYAAYFFRSHHSVVCLLQCGPGRIRTGDLRRVNAPLQLASAHAAASNPQNQLDHSPFSGHQVLAELALRFTRDELESYTERRKFGLTKYSMD